MTKKALHCNTVLKQLATSKQMNLDEAMRLLNVSESTVRRIFISLEDEGRVIRNHGGIQLMPTNILDLMVSTKEIEYREEADSICAKAVSLVEDQDVIYIGTGAVLAQFSMLLSRAIEQEKRSIKVFTNAIANLHFLYGSTEVNFLGGTFRPRYKDFAGYLTEESVKKLNFTKCFLGAEGYSAQNGFTCVEFESARIHELVLERAQTSYVLLEHSPLSDRGLVSYTQKKMPDYVLADEAVSEALTTSLTEKGARLIRCRS